MAPEASLRLTSHPPTLLQRPRTPPEIVNVDFTVPMETTGFYTVSATTSTGIYASTAFTVTIGSGSNQNTGTASEGFWTGINTLAVILVVAAAVIVPVTFMYMRRSGQEPAHGGGKTRYPAANAIVPQNSSDDFNLWQTRRHSVKV